MQHSGRSYPVVCVIDSVNIRRKGGGTFGELAAAYTQEVIKNLPQNVTTFQGGNHAIWGTGGESAACRPSAVAAGQPAGLGHGVCGSEAGQ